MNYPTVKLGTRQPLCRLPEPDPNTPPLLVSEITSGRKERERLTERSGTQCFIGVTCNKINRNINVLEVEFRVRTMDSDHILDIRV